MKAFMEDEMEATDNDIRSMTSMVVSAFSALALMLSAAIAWVAL